MGERTAMKNESEKRLAVIFPGIGYHKDKPLLYYAAKLLQGMGYEVINIIFSDMPGKIKGDKVMIKKAAGIASLQAEEQLAEINFAKYDKVIFVGKSIGTVALAKYVYEHKINAKQVWYTPLEETFSYNQHEVIAFIGESDPWSDVDNVKKIALDQGIKLYSYEGCNHSLESENIDKNLTILHEVIKKTQEYSVKNHIGI